MISPEEVREAVAFLSGQGAAEDEAITLIMRWFEQRAEEFQTRNASTQNYQRGIIEEQARTIEQLEIDKVVLQFRKGLLEEQMRNNENGNVSQA